MAASIQGLANENCILAGVNRLGRFLRDLGALLSHEKAPTVEQDIEESLSIHSNIMVFGKTKHLQLVAGKIVANQSCDLSRLKGHNLSASTMRFSMPAILLQIYANPCLYWLHEPAFYVLSNRIQRDHTIFDDMKEMKRIFATEFVVNQNDEDAVIQLKISIISRLVSLPYVYNFRDCINPSNYTRILKF